MKSVFSFIVIALIAFSGNTHAQSNTGGAPLSNPTFQIRGSIQTSSGQPGGGLSFLVRGQSSISGNTEPLFVIDGVIVDEDNFGPGMLLIDSENISSVNFLNASSARVLYGAQSANGVVVITTKRGKTNSTKLE